jgi:hypothetical protein
VEIMAARAAKGLSAADQDTLRAQVDAGRRPKVVFTANAGQIAGQTGQVTALDDPAASDEWITVRFGKDELPFAPGDLQLAPKPAKGAAKAAPARTARRRAEEAAPEVPSPRSAPAVPAPSASVPAARSGGDRAAASSPATPATPASRSAPASGGRPAAATPAPAPASAPKPARKAARGKGPAELAVTLSWRDGDWSVQAHRGTRVVARPAPVKAADALRMVGMLDAPEVAEVVAEIVEAERSAAQEQAERLRQELAAVEAKLAELP